MMKKDLKNCTDFIKKDFEQELKECILHKWNPYYHVVNWNHLKLRITGQYTSLPGSLACGDYKRIQAEIDKVISDIKPVVEKWLAYYSNHNKDGFYDSWIHTFWTGEKPDAEIEVFCYMHRMFEKCLMNGLIEIYDYQYASDEEKESFLQKWNLKYNEPYSENEERRLYVGKKGKLGEFYEGISDFFEPKASPKESDWWKLVSQVLRENN